MFICVYSFSSATVASALAHSSPVYRSDPLIIFPWWVPIGMVCCRLWFVGPVMCSLPLLVLVLFDSLKFVEGKFLRLGFYLVNGSMRMYFFRLGYQIIELSYLIGSQGWEVVSMDETNFLLKAVDCLIHSPRARLRQSPVWIATESDFRHRWKRAICDVIIKHSDPWKIIKVRMIQGYQIIHQKEWSYWGWPMCVFCLREKTSK